MERAFIVALSGSRLYPRLRAAMEAGLEPRLMLGRPSHPAQREIDLAIDLELRRARTAVASRLRNYGTFVTLDCARQFKVSLVWYFDESQHVTPR